MDAYQIRTAKARTLLRDFLDGSISFNDFRVALTPWVTGQDDPFVDEVVGILFADGEARDTLELRAQLADLVIGESIPGPEQEGRLATVPGCGMQPQHFTDIEVDSRGAQTQA